MNKQRRSNRKGAKGIRQRLAQNKRSVSRRLFTERLEDRRLLTTFGDDYNPYHNYFVAEDVNGDFYLSPRDALAVITELNANGARDLSNDDSIAPDSKVDASGDGYLSPIDALSVITALNDAEGVGEFLSITLELQRPDGTPLQAGDRVMSGDDFLVEVKVADERDNPTYVFSAYLDIDYSAQLLMNGSAQDIVPDYLSGPDVLTEIFTLGGTDPSQFEGTDSNSQMLPFWTPGEYYPNTVTAWPWRYDNSGVWDEIDNDKDDIDAGKNPGDLDYFPNVDQFDEVGAFASFGGGPPDGGVAEALITGTLSADLQYDYPALVTFAGSGADLPTSDVLLLDAPDGFPGSIPPEKIIWNTVSVEIYKPLYARDGAETTQEDTPLTFTPDAELDIASTGTLSILSATDGTFGTVAIIADQLRYSPNLDYNVDHPPGTADTFTYTMSDGLGNTDTGTITVTVTPVNDDPIAIDDSATVAEDSGFTEITVIDDDLPGPTTAVDEAGQTISLTSVGAASNGTARIAVGDSTKVEYKPNADYFGPDSFTYTISDGNGGVDTGTVEIQVTPVNDDPTANDDSFPGLVEDTPATLDVLFNDTFAPDVGELLFITDVGTSTTGTAIDVSGVTEQGGTVSFNGAVNYTPPENYSGTDSFYYTITDGNTGHDIAMVTVTIAPVNDEPIPSLNEDFVARERLFPTEPSTDLLVLDGALPGPANDAFEQANQEVFVDSIVTQPTNGTVEISPDRKYVTYTPNVGNLAGQTDSFQYIITDDQGVNQFSVVADANILIDPGVRPYAINDVDETDEDQDVTIDVQGNDITDVTPTRFELVESIVNGTINGTNTLNLAEGVATIVGDQINFDPADDFFTTTTPVSFQYVIDDDEPGSEPSVATVFVTVNSVNDDPIAEDDGPIDLLEDTSETILSLTNDEAGPGNETEAIFLESHSDPANGTVEISADELSFTYTPDPHYYGNDSFTYTIRDAFGATSNTATVDLVIENVNDPPTAVGKSFPVAEDSSDNVLQVTFGDYEGVPNIPDGVDSISLLSLGTPSEGGTVVISGNNVLYTPAADFFGLETFTYTIEDTFGETSEALIEVHVDNVNDPPMVLNEDGIDSEVLLALKDFDDQPLDVLANDSIFPDVSEVLTIKELIGAGGQTGDSVTTEDGGTATIVTPGRTMVMYTPLAGFESGGTDFDTFDYVVTDGNSPNGEATGTALIDVIDAVPSEVSGHVYVDANADGQQHSSELKLAGIEVTLTGWNIRGVYVNQTATTGADGMFVFDGVLPSAEDGLGGYSIAAQTPRYMNDGVETILDTTSDDDYDPGVVGEDMFTGVTLGVWGASGRATDNYGFGESGLDASHIKLTQYLASYQRGALLAGDGEGDTFWWSMMEGWEGVSWMEFSFSSLAGPGNDGLATAQLTIRDGGGNEQTRDLNYYTHYDFAGDPRSGGCVIFLKGSAADMGFDLSSNDGGGAEGEAPMEAEELEMLAAGEYRKGVDAVFGSGDWA